MFLGDAFCFETFWGEYRGAIWAVYLLAPFVDVFRSGHVVGFVFDFSTLLALFVYVFIGYLLIELMQYLDRPH